LYWFDLVQEILASIRAHKLRSGLTLLGIIGGTVSVLVLLALGEGFYLSNKMAMDTLANNAIMGSPYFTSKPFRGQGQHQAIKIYASDIEQLQKTLPDILYASPVLQAQQRITLSYGKQTAFREVIGVGPAYQYVRKLNLTKKSRFINALDLNQTNKVVVIGEKLKTRLFGQQTAINKILKINGIPFRVIGVSATDHSGSFLDALNSGFMPAYIPYSTFIKLWGNQVISEFIVTPKADTDVNALKIQIQHYFAALLNYDPTDTQAIWMPNIQEFLQFLQWFFMGIQIFLGFCGASVLGIGGLGVANIMFLIVHERTREIGLRMALGATDAYIMWQIMLETFLFVWIGGVMGIVLSYGVVALLAHLSLPPWLGTPIITFYSVYITIGVLMMIALISGYFPAKRAQQMNPAVALIA